MAIAIRDTTYLLDFFQKKLTPSSHRTICMEIGDFVIHSLRSYSDTQMEKFNGLAMPKPIAEECPTICSRLWSELDVIPLVLEEGHRQESDDKFIFGLPEAKKWWYKSLDEQAESMARKCVRYVHYCYLSDRKIARTNEFHRLFGPENLPLLQVGFGGLVEVDTGFHVRLTNIDDFEMTVSHKTWDAVEYYAKDLKDRKVKIAFFSATPQGGGVALMRHALVRFSHSLGTDIRW